MMMMMMINRWYWVDDDDASMVLNIAKGTQRTQALSTFTWLSALIQLKAFDWNLDYYIYVASLTNTCIHNLQEVVCKLQSDILRQWSDLGPIKILVR